MHVHRLLVIVLLPGLSLVLPGCSGDTFLRYSGEDLPERPTGPGVVPEGLCSNTLSSDLDGDGEWDERKVMVYDDDGQPLYEQYAHGEGGALVFDAIYHFEWTDGRQTARRSDHDADGDIDSATMMVYGEDGDILREESDENLDGVIDIVTTWTYDELGNQSRMVMDVAADGIPDSVTEWDRNQDGEVLEASST